MFFCFDRQNYLFSWLLSSLHFSSLHLYLVYEIAINATCHNPGLHFIICSELLMTTVYKRTLSIHQLSAAAHLCPHLHFAVSFCLYFSEIKRD